MSAARKPQPYTYVALGDSLANGVGANNQGYPKLLSNLLQDRYDVALHLFAKNGQTSTQLFRKRQLFQDYLRSADLITINIGGNDLRITWKLYGHKPIPQAVQRKRFELALTTLANNWNELAKFVVENSPSRAKILFIGLHNPYQSKYPQTQAHVSEANKLLETICANHGIEYVNAYDIFKDPKKSGLMREELLANDNLHLNESGYALIAEYIYEKVSSKTWWRRLWQALFNKK